MSFQCVEAANGQYLPADGRSLCCKTTTLYSFASVFGEAKISPRLVPNPPLSAIEYVRRYFLFLLFFVLDINAAAVKQKTCFRTSRSLWTFTHPPKSTHRKLELEIILCWHHTNSTSRHIWKKSNCSQTLVMAHLCMLYFLVNLLNMFGVFMRA